ncbi:hypothetical protein SAMN05421508_10919 [Caenispirillum bisanense]|uniref:Uncharacterized protein n=1 Tax=Caenispirillum bisanense TaxID=414052 RepID=A0A286GV93_9PROT|nr:hypothetical protein SAMN05421508_10919 [Caenispirillum bisanense]
MLAWVRSGPSRYAEQLFVGLLAGSRKVCVFPQVLNVVRVHGLAPRSGREDGVVRIPDRQAPREAGPADAIPRA